MQKTEEQELRHFIRVALIIIIATFLVFRVMFNIILINGESMKPTLEDGDLILTQCLATSPERGDIITFKSEPHKNLIVKRVIAVAGDTVDIHFDSGKVFVNGVELDEPYVIEPTYKNMGQSFPVEVRKNSVFVLGDNRNHSLDSRDPQIGQIMVDQIKGKFLCEIF